MGKSMARRAGSGNNSGGEKTGIWNPIVDTVQKDGFGTRGGWWVVAQVPLLLLAYLIPIWTGNEVGGATAITYFGRALMVAGAALALGGFVSLGRGLTPFPQPLPGSVLRTGGAYAWVRHPLYSGLLFVATGWSLHSLSPIGLLFDLALAVFFDRKAAREEIWLAGKFPEYPAYRRRVKKLIPWLY